jgi:hypothetical protein
MFSEINFPSSPTTTLNSSHNHSAALNTFIIALKKRSSYRTPLLDSVLTSLEDFATSLKADMPGLPKRLIDDFRERVGTSLEMLVQVLGKVLESMGPGRGGGKHGIEAELFVGRVALYLAKSSSFLRDVAGDAEVNTGKCSRNQAEYLFMTASLPNRGAIASTCSIYSTMATTRHPRSHKPAGTAL